MLLVHSHLIINQTQLVTSTLCIFEHGQCVWESDSCSQTPPTLTSVLTGSLLPRSSTSQTPPTLTSVLTGSLLPSPPPQLLSLQVRIEWSRLGENYHVMSDTDICFATSQRKCTRLTRVHVECLCLDKDKMPRKRTLW